MDNVATTTGRNNSTADSTNRRLLLLLSLSPASKAIAKQAAGGKHHRARRGLDGGGASFRCRTCARCFATFQALGGHRTSHSRPRVRADGLDLLLGTRPGKKGAAAASDVHRCDTCGMVFPTGQALGGHMRRHRVAFEVAVLETMQATTTVSGLSEEEDGDDAGHVSSTLIQFI